VYFALLWILADLPQGISAAECLPSLLVHPHPSLFPSCAFESSHCLIPAKLVALIFAFCVKPGCIKDGPRPASLTLSFKLVDQRRYLQSSPGFLTPPRPHPFLRCMFSVALLPLLKFAAPLQMCRSPFVPFPDDF
jgi:hypothetical protein